MGKFQIFPDGRAAGSAPVSGSDFVTKDYLSGSLPEQIWVRGTGSGSAVLSGSHATALSDNAIAEGWYSTASSPYSHAEGENTTVTYGIAAHVEGKCTTASYHYAHAEGGYTEATNQYSHAEGNRTKARGESSHAEGFYTNASRSYSHAEGRYTTASQISAHAEGERTHAANTSSHAEGSASVASGIYSHAEGVGTTASGLGSHAEGLGTTAQSSYEHAQGRYNASALRQIFSIGVGDDATRRKNAISVITGSYPQPYSASIYIYGVGTYDGTNPAHGTNDIATVISNLTGSIASASYSSTDKKIYFFNAGGTASAEIDATDFIKDGMVDSVEVSGSYLVLTFNTDAGKEPVSMSLTRIFNPDNFYTKTDVDTLLSTMSVGDVNVIEAVEFNGTASSISGKTASINVELPAAPNQDAENWVTENSASIVTESVWKKGTGSGSAYLGDAFASGEGAVAHGQTGYHGSDWDPMPVLASGMYSHAEGCGVTASGPYSHAEGSHSEASGTGSHVEGLFNYAFGNFSHAEGNFSYAHANYSHAEGRSASARGEGSHAEGYNTEASGNYSHAEGRITHASGIGSHAEGSSSQAHGQYAHAEGYETSASGQFSHAEGFYTVASGWAAHAEGSRVTSTGTASHAEGFYTSASGTGSHAEGYFTQAPGNYSHAEGYITVAFDNYSHAEGRHTTASGQFSHAEGSGSSALRSASHAEGYGTIASGNYSHAEGHYSTAFGVGAHAEGLSTKAEGQNAHAEGQSTYAYGNRSHAEGYMTTASGIYSHAEGSGSKAFGVGAHAEGQSTEASNSYEHAQGKYNVTASKQIFSVGVGSGNNARKNAVSIITGSGETPSASIYVYGVGTYDGTNPQPGVNDLATIISASAGGGSDALIIDVTSAPWTNGGSGSGMVTENAEGYFTVDPDLWNQAAEALKNNRDVYLYYWNIYGSDGSGFLYRASRFFSGSVPGFINFDVCYDSNAGAIKAIQFDPNGNIFFKSTTYIEESEGFWKMFTWIPGEGSGSAILGNIDNEELNTATGQFAVAQGSGSVASGDYSHAEGYGTVASENYSHAEGSASVALGQVSHAEGWNTRASGNYSHTEGQRTTASALGAHAEGFGTKADSRYSHAEGFATTASAQGAHAEGSYTVATNYYEHAQGKHNATASNQIFSIGAGDTSSRRKNAVSIITGSGATPSASIYIYGIGGYNGTNPTPGTNDLATIINGLTGSQGGITTETDPVYLADSASLKNAATWVGSNSASIIASGALAKTAIQPAATASWDTAASQSHTHSNGSLLNSLTNAKTGSWDGAATWVTANSSSALAVSPASVTASINAAIGGITASHHTHSNKAVLDSITAAKTASWDSAATSATALNSISASLIASGTLAKNVTAITASLVASASVAKTASSSAAAISAKTGSWDALVGLPAVTAADNGKILRVVNGAWALVDPVTVYSGQGAPDSALGQDGDIYLQS